MCPVDITKIFSQLASQEFLISQLASQLAIIRNSSIFIHGEIHIIFSKITRYWLTSQPCSANAHKNQELLSRHSTAIACQLPKLSYIRLFLFFALLLALASQLCIFKNSSQLASYWLGQANAPKIQELFKQTIHSQLAI